MKELLEMIRKDNMRIYGITEVRKGVKETVYPNDYELHDSIATVRNIYSVSKAFTMAAVGFCFDDGLLKPSDSLGRIFGKLPQSASAGWADVNVDNLLRHETGCRRGDDLDASNLRDFTDGDWMEYILRKPIEEEPGKTERYSDINFFLLSCIVTKLTGMSMLDYMRQKFFNPTAFREVAWSADPEGRNLGGTALYISTDDMVKLGQLWLQRGMWNGRRLVSVKWIDLSLERSYAFSCRSRKAGTFYKTGMLGQILIFSYRDDYVLGVEAYSRQTGKLVDAAFPDAD